MDQSGYSALCCSNCQRPLRALSLAGHYNRSIEIDICESCYLIWFDGTESVRLAGPGVLDLLHIIHEKMQHSGADTLAVAQQCPRCQSRLKNVLNQTRFGRTQHSECPQGHGYFQTFVLYLAEKGYIRPITWADLKQIKATGRKLYCASCGASMDERPHQACPYCQSSVGVLDPERLAQAIDLHQASEPSLAPMSEAEQMRCLSCGGSIDPSRDQQCPQCHAPVRRKDTQSALQAGAQVADKVRQNYAEQLPEVSEKKLQNALNEHVRLSDNAMQLDTHWQIGRAQIALGVAALALVIWLITLAMTLRPKHKPPQTKPGATASSVPAVAAVAAVAANQRLGQAGGTNPRAQASAHSDASLSVGSEANSEANSNPDKQASLTQMVSFPRLRCAPEAAERREVKIRQMVIPVSTDLEEMRAAYMLLSRVRTELEAGANFNELRNRYPKISPASPSEDNFIPKGKAILEVNRVAFCLPQGSLSPVFKSITSFHLIEILDAH